MISRKEDWEKPGCPFRKIASHLPVTYSRPCDPQEFRKWDREKRTRDYSSVMMHYKNGGTPLLSISFGSNSWYFNAIFLLLSGSKLLAYIILVALIKNNAKINGNNVFMTNDFLRG